MSIDKRITEPCIETLLDVAHQNRDLLYERRRMLELRGIDRNHLPDDVSIMAFALLGEHEREVLLVQLRDHWDDLQTKGLVSGGIDNATTPELRLFMHALDQFEVIGTAWQQLRAAVDTKEPPQGVWNSTRKLNGPWGELKALKFQVKHVSRILIEPDPIFGLQPALLVADPNLSHSGTVTIPIDNGTISISLLHRTGEIYRLIVSVNTEDQRG